MKRWFVLGIAGAHLCLSWGGAALASDRTSVDVAGGPISVEQPAVQPFASMELNGDSVQIDAALESFSVSDARGTGSGWDLLVSATPFRTWDPESQTYSGNASLPEGSLRIGQLEVSAVDTTSAVPEIASPGLAIDGTTVAVASAKPGTGMGRFRFSSTEGLQLSVPSSTYAGVYRSEITFSLSTGP